MTSPKFVAGYRLLCALLGTAALVAQFVHGASRLGGAFDPVKFFSFFTIESNILFAIVLYLGALYAWRGRTTAAFEWARGAVAVYMVVVGIVYVALLSGLEDSLMTTLPWVNTVLHYLLPVVALLDWILVRADRPITFGQALAWVVFPLIYLAYSLIRGAIVGWYPYPFLDPTQNGGYLGVAVTSVLIAVLAVGLILAAASVTRWPRGLVRIPVG